MNYITHEVKNYRLVERTYGDTKVLIMLQVDLANVMVTKLPYWQKAVW